MIRENRLDVLLVAGPDYSHCDRILAGLRHNLRVVAGKPVVINCEEVRRLLGSLAIAVGEAIWRSAQDGKPYQIRDLLGDCYRS